MATPLSLTRDVNGYPTTGQRTSMKFSDLNQYFTLTQNAVKTVTVPVNNSSRMMAVFTYSSGANVFVLPASTPTLTAPNGTVTATLATMNPGAREVVGGQVLQMLTDQTGVIISISYYAIL